MVPEPPFSFEVVAAALNEIGVRFVLIGRQAVVLYGSPVMSFDFDIWIDPSGRRAAFELLEKRFGYEISARAEDVAPIVRVYAGRKRMDVLTMRSMVNRDGVVIDFDEVYARSRELRDPSGAVVPIRVPAIDDLIATKRMSPSPRPKDEEDIA